MARKMIRHDELKNGMQVWVQGFLFVAGDVRTIEDPRMHGAVAPAADLVRFTGRCSDRSCSLAGTGYDGGTYGARVDVLCTIELEGN